MKKRILILAFVVILANFGIAHSGAFEDGVAAHGRGDYSESLRIWKPLAEQGHIMAQYNLGAMYAIGKGIPQDNAEAERWYRKAADQGLADAQWVLGIKYENLKNPSAAVDWYYKAGMSFLENGQRDEAQRAYDLIEKISPGHSLGNKLKEAMNP